MSANLKFTSGIKSKRSNHSAEAQRGLLLKRWVSPRSLKWVLVKSGDLVMNEPEERLLTDQNPAGVVLSFGLRRLVIIKLPA